MRHISRTSPKPPQSQFKKNSHATVPLNQVFSYVIPCSLAKWDLKVISTKIVLNFLTSPWIQIPIFFSCIRIWIIGLQMGACCEPLIVKDPVACCEPLVVKDPVACCKPLFVKDPVACCEPLVVKDPVACCQPLLLSIL